MNALELIEHSLTLHGVTGPYTFLDVRHRTTCRLLRLGTTRRSCNCGALKLLTRVQAILTATKISDVHVQVIHT